MIYEFQAADGTIIERDMPMANAPAFGVELVVDGKAYRRIMSSPVNRQITAQYDGNAYPKVSNALPQWAPGAEHTPDGKCILRNANHQADMCKQHGFVRDYHHNDNPPPKREPQFVVPHGFSDD